MPSEIDPQSNQVLAQKAYQSGDFPRAAELFFRAAQESRDQSNALAAAEMLNNASVAYLKASQPQQAWEAAQGTDETFAQAGDQRRQAMALGNQAAALEGLNQLDEAIRRYERSSDILAKTGEKELRALVLKSLSALQIRKGDQLQAMASMQAALGSQKKLSVKERFLKKLLDIPFRMLKR